MAKNANHISHKKNKQIVEGKPKLPLASDLVEGEIAINFAKDVETISIKNESGDVVTFSSDNYFINEKGGFKRETNPSADTKVGLVNSLSQYYDTNIGKGAVIEGDGNENNNIVASGDYSHAEGYSTIASGTSSHAEGSGTTANGNQSHAEGQSTKASGACSHAEGYYTTASGWCSHAEGHSTKASGDFSHAEGYYTTASGDSSHVEGYYTTASNYSHAEGYSTTASGNQSHAEGGGTTASGAQSHAEGAITTASGAQSHAEGLSATASGSHSHAEGYETKATNQSSHAEGYATTASGSQSHSEGYYTVANNDSEHASGQYNISKKASTTFGNSGNTLFSVGNGTSNSARHNAFEIRQNGDIYISSGGTDILLQDNLGGVVDQVIDSGTSASTNAVATKAVYDVITDNELVWTNAYVAMSGIVSSHTENTEIHVTAADKEKLHTHTNKASLDSITGNVGTMAYEAASSYSSATEVNTALRNKANTSDIANFFDNAKYEDSGSTKVINFYHGNTVKATIDASNFIKDGMVDDVRIENGNLVIDFNTDAGKQDISIPLTDIFDPSNYYNKTAIDNLVGSGFTSSSITDVIIENEEIVASALNDLEERKLDASAYTPTDLSNYYTKSETSGKTEISNALSAKVNSATFTGHTADTTIHVTQADKDKWNNAGGGFVEVTNPSAETKVGLVNKLSQYYDTNIGKGAVIEGDGSNDNKKISASAMRSHAEGSDTTASGYGSHAEGLSTIAKGAYSHAEGGSTTASGLSSHAEGSSTQAIGRSSHAEGDGTTASGYGSHAEGLSTIAKGYDSHAEGQSTTASGSFSHAEGDGTTASNHSEHASGRYNVSSSASTTFGNSGNTLFSVGNGTSTSARHNAFEIRQNGDIYISNNGSDIKLQDFINDINGQSETVAAALNDLNTNKADKSTTYTKSEIDDMIGDIETLLAAI